VGLVFKETKNNKKNRPSKECLNYYASIFKNKHYVLNNNINEEMKT